MISTDISYFKNNLIKLFLKKLQHSGKYIKAEKFLKNLILELQLKSNINPLTLIEQAILNLAPPVIIKKKKFGGTIYYIPTPITLNKAISIGISWLLDSVKTTHELAIEIINLVNLQGNAWKKKQQYIKMALQNRVFSHISFLNFFKSTQYNKYFYYKNDFIEKIILNNKQL